MSDNNNDTNENEVNVVITNVTEEELTSSAYVETPPKEIPTTGTTDPADPADTAETTDTTPEDDKPTMPTTSTEPTVAKDELKGRVIKLIMPSIGDMQVLKQDGGVIYLQPFYFSNVCSGPIIQFIDLYSSGKNVVSSSYRVMFKPNGEARLAKAD
jgi:hypothetical protein